MAAEFEFRLIGGTAPSGELEADDLIALAQSLKEVATKLSRREMQAEPIGRPGKRTREIASLAIGLASGSTRVLVHRLTGRAGALDFDLDEERAFDEKFEALVKSIARDERPAWMPTTLAIATGKLRAALEGAAEEVEFAVDGDVRTIFSTASTHRETWQVADIEADVVTFVGRLRAVNLDSHRLQVTDDLEHKIALIDVEDDAKVGRLLNEYVSVTGYPELDAKGRLSRIYLPKIEPAQPLPADAGVRDAVPLEEILSSAAGPVMGGITDLTDDEVRSFFEAIGR
ncbi:hypothetical protein [Microbacterium sp. KNMS]